MKKTAYLQPEMSVHQIPSLRLLSMSQDGDGIIQNIDIFDEDDEYNEEDLEIL